jgi:riboflavin synthase
MFTGIVTAIGTIDQTEQRGGALRLWIAAPYADLALGESIAVDGACLTVEEIDRSRFAVQVVATSLERTTFGAHAVGRKVNLERALAVGERLGGHLVSGHVDGLAEVTRVEQVADGTLIELQLPAEVAEVTIPLGSLTVNGVSLTVNSLPTPGSAEVSLIPHTLAVTTLGGLRAGDQVHVEGDMIGKYVRQFVVPWKG